MTARNRKRPPARVSELQPSRAELLMKVLASSTVVPAPLLDTHMLSVANNVATNILRQTSAVLDSLVHDVHVLQVELTRFDALRKACGQVVMLPDGTSSTVTAADLDEQWGVVMGFLAMMRRSSRRIVSPLDFRDAARLIETYGPAPDAAPVDAAVDTAKEKL